MSRTWDERPVWAGVAIRWPNGRITAVEIDYPIGELTINTEEVEDLDESLARGWRVRRPGPKSVVVNLSGALSRGWAQGEEAARRHAVEAITAGPAAIETNHACREETS
jgi:hypothetical protein